MAKKKIVVETPIVTDAPTNAPMVANAPIQPLEIKTALLAAHDDVVALENKIKDEVALTAYTDIQDISTKIEEVRQWFVAKLVYLDPELADKIKA
jgi:uncharacterized protein (UPF0264 family)